MFRQQQGLTKVKLAYVGFCALFFTLQIQTTDAQSLNTVVNVDAIFPAQAQTNKTIMLAGTVEAKQHAQLAPLAQGRVAEIFTEIGDVVKKGHVLLTLNSKLAELEIQGAIASVNALRVNEVEAKRLFTEAKKLSQQQVVPQTLILERQALVANSQAQLKRAEAALSLQQELLNRHTLRAPFDGVIALRNVDLGEWITQQTPAFTLVAQDNLRLSVAVPQEYYGRLAAQTSLAVRVFLDSSSTQYTSATISRLVPVSNAITRTFIAQIDLPANIGLVAGMSARAQILVPNTNSTFITLPRSAVKQHPDGGSSVFTVVNGKAKRVITPYTSLPNNMVSIANQPADVAYILTGIELLQNGTPINTNIVTSAQ
jgi:RND family efflux transporter MFP subunit